ncbi:MAG TPA: TrbI/VirB10 family protein [Edaphobacter sp.]|uniref:TrbI/VirB10 family protein n=1 Tax=Edaphobacter sp. TaxID=1934404 RepID=UPI002C4D3E7E|nr:TrbI/VirB10 family protein [Edaphobacter sp.]HUZ96068.1 TrbI/VirB10 family protein [Edaphobacter sp.]
MSVNDTSRNGSMPTTIEESTEPVPSNEPTQARESTVLNGRHEPATAFATRADTKGVEGISKSKLVLLGGGLAVAVLFFVFTALVGKSPKKPTQARQPSQQANQELMKPPKGSVTPVMDTVRTPAPDNSNGQLGPGDIRRTRSLNDQAHFKPVAAKPSAATSLGSVPSFADTQQKWEDPVPYGGPPAEQTSQVQQNGLKEPSIIFVRSVTQNQAGVAPKVNSDDDGVAILELKPGTRIQAKLETQISSAVQAPVVAVVEYTYAIGDRIIVPAGARVYGQLQQADRSGLVGVKFDEIELLDGAREKIDAIGTGLDLGPIKGNVYGKNTGKNFLVRAASGIGSVLAEVAGNNSSAAFSESDMLRERLAENIGTAGDSEVMSLNANSRVVVSVPADTKIYVVFTKHEQRPAELHKVVATAQ